MSAASRNSRAVSPRLCGTFEFSIVSALCLLAHRSVLERGAKPTISPADKRESLELVVGHRRLLTDAADGQDRTDVDAERTGADGLDRHFAALLPALEQVDMIPL